MKRNIVGHNFVKGGSDKLYLCGIREQSNTYSVIAKWGKRGNHLSVQNKGTFKSLAEAEAFQKKLWNSKVTGGYMDIEDPMYTQYMSADVLPKKVSMSDEMIKRNLEYEDYNSLRIDKNGDIWSEDNNPLSNTNKKKAKEVKQYVMICVDNVGMEDKFDVEIEYVVEDHIDKEMIYAYDKHGERGEFFKMRFEKGK